MTKNGNNPYDSILFEKLTDSLDSLPEKGTKRLVSGREAIPKKATAVIGMRRAGKTTYIHQVRHERLEKGTYVSRLPYINFEDERLAGMEAAGLARLVEEYYRRYPSFRGKETVVWCFDEIQLVAGWERFVRRLLDTEKVEIFITGSSAALLSREIATSLRGRAWEVAIYPFSFREALYHSGHRENGDNKPLSSRERSMLEHQFLEYLVTGGFPEIQGADAATRQQLLTDYVDVAILRDVVERHRVTNVAGLRWLVRHILGNAASLFSVEKFFSSLKSQGFAISKDTVHQLLAFIEDSFLVRTVWMESSSERQRMVNPRKVYPIDPGLIPVFDRQKRKNTGHALETVVMIELERRKTELTYVRTPNGHEVDFLARIPGKGMELIQVCADPGDPDTLAREVRALEEAGRIHKKAVKRLLTLTRVAPRPAIPDDVIVQPVYEWLLQP
ncbi:MAG: ATP-binding protein [Spirochaetaceae bacterium]|nr:MAG: ATP-binding protein [Spirochaetaceae bacterium]